MHCLIYIYIPLKCMQKFIYLDIYIYMYIYIYIYPYVCVCVNSILVFFLCGQHSNGNGKGPISCAGICLVIGIWCSRCQFVVGLAWLGTSKLRWQWVNLLTKKNGICRCYKKICWFTIGWRGFSLTWHYPPCGHGQVFCAWEELEPHLKYRNAKCGRRLVMDFRENLRDTMVSCHKHGDVLWSFK